MSDQKENRTRETEQEPVRWLKWMLIVLFVIWMFWAIAAYFVVQKPFSVEQFGMIAAHADVWLRVPVSVLAVGRALLDLGTAVWIAWVATGLGLFLLAGLKIDPDVVLEKCIYALGSGLGVLGLLVLGVGLLGWLHTWILFGLLLGLTILTLRPVLLFIKQIRPSKVPTGMTLYLVIALGLALFLVLLPPYSWDAMSYHLVGPKMYLAAGRIYAGIDNPPLNYPFLQEMLYMLAMGLRGDVSAKLLHFWFNFLLAGLVFVIARDQLQVKRAGFAVLFLFGIPMILTLSAQAYNDLALTFYQVVAVLTFLQWRTKKADSWLILTGIFCGFGMGIKYTSFVTPLVLALFVGNTFRGKWRAGIRPLFMLTLSTTLIALPWFIKNLFFTGNPVYPFLFNGLFWDEFRAASFAGAGTGIGFDLLAILRLPYEISVGIGDASQDGAVGVFLLLFLPLIVAYAVTPLGRHGKRPFKYLILFALAQFLFWVLGVVFSQAVRQSRFLLPAFVALCPVMAWILEDLARFDTQQFSLRRLLGMVIVFVLLLNLVGQILQWLPVAPHTYVIGTDSEDALLTRMLGAQYKATQGINQLPEDAVVLFLWEPRSYYCQRECRADVLLDNLSHAEYLYDDLEGIVSAWQADGITHLLSFDAGYQFLLDNPGDEVGSRLPRDRELVNALFANYLEPVAEWDGAYSLYEFTLNGNGSE